MDLHGLVRSAITTVNPDVPATLKVSDGYTTAATGKQVPTYLADAAVLAQVQDLSQRDILHLDSLNVQGSQKAIYLRGEVSGIDRSNGKGNDLIVFPDGTRWAATAVLEQWPDWVRVSVTKQNGA